MNQKGLAPIVIVVLIAALAIGGYLIYKLPRTVTPSPTPQATPISANSAARPVLNGTGKTVYTEASQSADWKTYTDSKYGFSFKYSPQLRVENNSTGETQILGEDYPTTDNRMSIQVATQKDIITAPGINVANLLPLNVGEKYGHDWVRLPDTVIDNKVAKTYEEQWIDTKSKKKGIAKEFIVVEKNLYYIIESTSLNENSSKVFIQILSTFRFLP